VSPADADSIRLHVRDSMASLLKTRTAGDAPITVLDDCLAFARASDAAFPSDSERVGLRNKARETRTALQREMVVLRALDAGEQSDAF
jgi:hypothetical protein